MSVSALDAQASRLPGERVVFMGNSIFETWAPHFPEMFPGGNYIGRGVSGETTAQMLVRFRRDVIDLRPRIVVILAGTNDIAGNGGPVTLGMIETNIASMARMARDNGVKVVLASVLPAAEYPWRRNVRPAETIVALNAWLRDYAERERIIFLDYHSAMRNEQNGLRAELGPDGVHPNRAGFLVMAPLTETAIREALSKSSR